MNTRLADYQRAESEALKLLSKNSISSPPIDLVKIADGEGLNIAIAEFKEGNVSGFIDLDKKLILVNKYDSAARQRFTIAHELGHWVLHQPELIENRDIVVFYRKELEEKETDPLEQEANCFAANLLVPTSLLDALLNVSFSDKTIAEIFRVSEPVIVFRRKFSHAN